MEGGTAEDGVERVSAWSAHLRAKRHRGKFGHELALPASASRLVDRRNGV